MTVFLDLFLGIVSRRQAAARERAAGRAFGARPPAIPALGRRVEAIERALGIAAGRPARIAFKQVIKTEPDVKVDLAIGDTSTGVVEQKLRGWIIALTGRK